MTESKLCKTRFVILSDTHNAHPGGAFKLPKGDVLIHAGDLTNQGSYSELQKTVQWLEEADFEAKIVIAGNHDITLDSDFYSQYGLHFHNQDSQDTARCQALLDNSHSILWLKHEAAVVKLQSPSGPQTIFKIFGSPLSPADGMWAFGYGVQEATQIWENIPLDSDIVVTHTPPKHHCDERKDRRAAGCGALRNALWRVRPRMAICGHVHEGRGVERVRWDLSEPNIKFKEGTVERWEDPGLNNKKISFIDLTIKGRKPIDNDGFAGDFASHAQNTGATAIPSPGPALVMTEKKLGFSHWSQPRPTTEPRLSPMTASRLAALPDLPPATRGQGGVPPSQRLLSFPAIEQVYSGS
ncbi:hypothetical protein LZ554_000434 [Drepanopeziza brunnea f. sp. 'monogermtubi']|nr:hypothetical protein LZ554_000434 [Drepanopeziza brunnea f. sp. 'monogermtubi']